MGKNYGKFIDDDFRNLYFNANAIKTTSRYLLLEVFFISKLYFLFNVFFMINHSNFRRFSKFCYYSNIILKIEAIIPLFKFVFEHKIRATCTPLFENWKYLIGNSKKKNIRGTKQLLFYMFYKIFAAMLEILTYKKFLRTHFNYRTISISINDVKLSEWATKNKKDK